MNEKTDSETKLPKINYYGFIFVSLGTGNFLCFHLLRNVPGTIVTIFRVALMSSILAVIVTISKDWRKLDKEDWLPMIVGALSFAAYTLFLTLGMQKTSVINGAILFNFSPIFSMFFAVMFKQEKWSWSAFAGAAVALAGVLIASLGGSSSSDDSLLGDLYVILSSVSIALGTVYAHRLGNKHRPLAQTSIMGLFGLMLLLPFSVNDFVNVQWTTLSNIDWAMLLYIGVFGGAIAFAAYFKSVEIFGASSTMIFIFLAIPITILLNYIFLHEVPALHQILGAVIVIGGAGWSVHARAKQGKVMHFHGHP